MTLEDAFVDNLARHLDRTGMSQNELAEASGAHYVTISRILNRHMSPSLALCERLAKAAGMRPEKSFQKIA